ncbi:MAG: atpF [Rickettsiales bacterium]|nr:atpF [Rickettsiales bacterium]
MIDLEPSTWVALGFVILVAALAKPVSRIVCSVLDERAARIKNELEEAVRLKEEAQAILASYQRKQKDALEEASRIVAHAEKEAAQMITRAHEELETALNRRIALTMQKIETYEKSVLQEVRGKAIDAAINRVYDIFDSELSRDAAQELINDSVATVRKSVLH